MAVLSEVFHLGYGVGGILVNDRWGQWVWSMSLKKSWSLCCSVCKTVLCPQSCQTEDGWGGGSTDVIIPCTLWGSKIPNFPMPPYALDG